MIAGFIMCFLGWFVLHQWGLILGGVMFFMLGVGALKPIEGGEEGGLQAEGEDLKTVGPPS